MLTRCIEFRAFYLTFHSRFGSNFALFVNLATAAHLSDFAEMEKPPVTGREPASGGSWKLGKTECTFDGNLSVSDVFYDYVECFRQVL